MDTRGHLVPDMLKHSRILLLATVLFGAVAVFPRESVAQNYPPSVKALVAEATKQARTTDMAGLKAAYDRKDGRLILDVRGAGEYAAGHVDGAVNVPRGLIEFAIWEHVGFPDRTDMNRKIYLYCRSGSRVVLAAKSLRDLGFTNITAVTMKFADWEEAGYPVAE